MGPPHTGRICTAVNLKAANARYYSACLTKFRAAVPLTSTPGCPQSDDVIKAMQVIYSYLEESDDYQFCLHELCDLV